MSRVLNCGRGCCYVVKWQTNAGYCSHNFSGNANARLQNSLRYGHNCSLRPQFKTPIMSTSKLTKRYKNERKWRGEEKLTVARELIEEILNVWLELYELSHLHPKVEWTKTINRTNRRASSCKVCTMPVIGPNRVQICTEIWNLQFFSCTCSTHTQKKTHKKWVSAH